MLSTAVALAIVYGLSPYVNQSTVPEISFAVKISYGPLHRTAWACVIAWIIFACSRGYGGLSSIIVSLLIQIFGIRLSLTQVSLTMYFHGRVSYHSAGWLIASSSSIMTIWTCSTPPCGSSITTPYSDRFQFTLASLSSFLDWHLWFPSR